VVACGRLHATPQPPQSVIVVVDRSQPFDASPSQFAKPALHAPSVHEPVLQLSPAFGRSQPTPHAPQSLVVLIARSQPLTALPSQFAKCASHAPSVHVPVMHDSPAFARSHATPQPPQSVSVWIDRSQPLALLPSQLAKPGSQVSS
jgi:hypothetical protein